MEYENRMLRRPFGPERKEVAGGWRRLHNKMYHIACMGRREIIQNLVGKPEGRQPRVRPRRRWEDNIRKDL
jgi:hypothetical protein